MRTTTLLLLVGAAAVLIPSGPGRQVFRSGVELVRVDVSVTRNDRPVTGLGPDDFIITDNGVRRPITAVVYEQTPLEVWLVLDMSRSVRGQNLDALRGAAHELLQGLRQTDEAALVTFSQRVEIRQALTPEVGMLSARLASTTGNGMTALRDAVYTALLQRRANDKRAALVVFSDAADNMSWLSEDDVMGAARATDVLIYGVTVPGFVRRGASAERADRFLRELAAATGGDVWEARNLQALAEVFVRVLREIRQRYLITYAPGAPAEKGWHRIEVSLEHARGEIKARRGYLR